jgi:arylsulfatase A-like enzyme
MATETPNFVFIFTDDWGWGDLGCYGHRHLKTPNLDALAAEGTIYTQFYVCSGVCSPSRAAAITGRFPSRFGLHGHLANHDANAQRGMPDWLDPEVPTFMRILQKAGYATAHYGKWHLGNGSGAPEPFAYGIDECKVNSGNGPALSIGKEREDMFRLRTRRKSSEVIIDETISFIERNQGGPFMVNVWLNDTHAILDPDEEMLDPYRGYSPQFIADEFPGAPAVYFAAATNADRHVGRLVHRLKELNLFENTVLIFSSDNGPEDILVRNASHSGAGSPGPFRGRKRSLYEGGVRTPFILSWPAGGAKPGGVDKATPLCAVDLFPTFCSLAGVPLPDDLKPDGEDMSDVFRGTRRTRTTPLFWEWRFPIVGHPLNRSPMLSVRDGDWKLLFNPDGSRTELYSIPDDPMELDDLAEENPKVVSTLSKKAITWQNELPEGPIHPEAGSNAYPWPEER